MLVFLALINDFWLFNIYQLQVILKLNSTHFSEAFPVLLKVLLHCLNIPWKPECADVLKEKSTFNFYFEEAFDLIIHKKLEKFKNWVKCERLLEVFDVDTGVWEILYLW